MRTEGNFIVDKIHLVNYILAHESRAHVIIWIGIGSGATFLKPEKCVLHAVHPCWILCNALIGIGRGRNLKTKFIPIGTTTTSLIGTLSVAGAHTHTGIEVPVCKAVLWSRETLVTIERISIVLNNATNLIC